MPRPCAVCEPINLDYVSEAELEPDRRRAALDRHRRDGRGRSGRSVPRAALQPPAEARRGECASELSAARRRHDGHATSPRTARPTSITGISRGSRSTTTIWPISRAAAGRSTVRSRRRRTPWQAARSSPSWSGWRRNRSRPRPNVSRCAARSPASSRRDVGAVAQEDQRHQRQRQPDRRPRPERRQPERRRRRRDQRGQRRDAGDERHRRARWRRRPARPARRAPAASRGRSRPPCRRGTRARPERDGRETPRPPRASPPPRPPPPAPPAPRPRPCPRRAAASPPPPTGCRSGARWSRRCCPSRSPRRSPSPSARVISTPNGIEPTR